MEVINIEGQYYLISNENPNLGDTYAFKEPNVEKWHLAKRFNYFPSAIGKNAIELLNPEMIRKKIVKKLIEEPSRETIKKIIELTAHEQEDGGDVWGDDTVLGTMDEIIDKALEIIRKI
jgi:hypothetical protein